MLDKIAQIRQTIDPTMLEEQLNAANTQQEQMLQFVDKVQASVLAFLPLMIIVGLAVSVVFIVGAIYKMRVDRAILRIDKNLQQLLDTTHTSQPEQSSNTDKSVENI